MLTFRDAIVNLIFDKASKKSENIVAENYQASVQTIFDLQGFDTSFTSTRLNPVASLVFFHQ